MQLPGMCTDPVRVSLDVTWFPDSSDFGVSRRLWTRPHRGGSWQLEDVATTGSPLTLVTLRERWPNLSDVTLGYFLELVEQQGNPFP